MPLVEPSTASATVDPVTFGRRTEERALPVHWAWVVAAVSFVAILGAAGFRSVPGVMMNPLHHEFGWSHGMVGLAMAVNMTLFGLTAPFAAALMDRFGVRPVLSAALLLIATGSALSVTMTASWQLVLLWGVLVGVGTGVDLDGLRRDRRHPVVRGAARPGHRCANRRERDRATDLPARRRRGRPPGTAGAGRR